MTDEQIVKIASSVDVFVHDLMDENKLDIVDISAVINSRLRALSVEDELESDYDALMDHLNSQTIIVPRTVH
jgi:translation elongation factor EF-Tu-like GTPase